MPTPPWPSVYKGSVPPWSDTLSLSAASLNQRSAMMPPSVSGLLLTCLLLPGLTQGQEDAAGPPSARKSCPQGFALQGSHCYGLLGPEETWNTAELLCQAYPSGHLVSLLNEAEASFVATMIMEHGIKGTPVWIGLHDPNKNRRWRWSSNALYLYQAWTKGSPNGTNPNYCVSLTPESDFRSWKDVPCHNKYLYLCKFTA
ncbi:lithostathine-1-alpha-like [Dromiciops gliroides]|uniref:lithostathine-1-alpha-like n=1 Tax=Dromiciops gliroides TaxID=33562 RepID=UPI001CC4ED28|nr:lithostathine-1-alpha-like [Dromiciops gliroides]